jgi:hypothetical protein
MNIFAICAYSTYKTIKECIMPQLHLYVPEDLAAKVREKAKARNLTVSRYLAEVIRREVGEGWPEGYFDRVCGKWEGEFPELSRQEAEELEKEF